MLQSTDHLLSVHTASATKTNPSPRQPRPARTEAPHWPYREKKSGFAAPLSMVQAYCLMTISQRLDFGLDQRNRLLVGPD